MFPERLSGTATCRYRCEHLAATLREKGAQAEVVYIGQPRVRVSHDVVVLYRVCATAEGRRFARAARNCGATLVYSTDDLVFDADEAPTSVGKRFRTLAPLHRAMLSEADAALASTEYLADRMRFVAPETPVQTIRNFPGADLIRRSEAARRKAYKQKQRVRVTLGYLSGTATHDADLATIAEPLRRVLEADPSTELLLVGPVQLPPGLRERETAGQVRRRTAVPWQALPELMAEEQITVNLAPLDLSRPFCHAKSEVKFLEAAALGIPTVASASRGFREAVPDAEGKQGCFLADGLIVWERWLRLLSHNRQAVAEAGARAYTFVTSDAKEKSMPAGYLTSFSLSKIVVKEMIALSGRGRW